MTRYSDERTSRIDGYRTGYGLIHCQVFLLLYGAVGMTQATSNLAAFSFYVNALYIFEPGEPWRGYLLCTGVMGLLSYGLGSVGDALSSPGWMTLALYFWFNLAIGYGFFRFKSVRGRRWV